MSRRLAVFVSLVFAFTAFAQDGRDHVVRHTYSGYLPAFTPFLADEMNAWVGDRIVAVASPGSAPVDVVVQRWDGTTWSNVGWLLPPALPGPTTRQLDYRVTATGTHRAIMRTTTWDGTNYIFSVDLSPSYSSAALNSAANTCFGAIGPDCAFDPISGNCIRLPSGGLACKTSVGSQKHDSCCSAVGPNGSMCAFPLPPFPTPGLCSGEWGVATNDVLGGRSWTLFYDPTFVSY